MGKDELETAAERGDTIDHSTIAIKRVYDRESAGDGKRVFVDRLWPRGVTSGTLKFDLWAKELAPSPGLRKWFGHVPERFPQFRMRYLQELAANPEVDSVLPADPHERLTLLYAAKDPVHNHAVV